MNETKMQSAFSEEVGAAMPSDFSIRARVHYAKALSKHPRFADRLFGYVKNAGVALEAARRDIAYLKKHGWLDAVLLAMCELDEACVPYVQGDVAACVDELYDAIAVIMRMIAVLEKKQTLGRGKHEESED